jgi:hypothetical protein
MPSIMDGARTVSGLAERLAAPAGFRPGDGSAADARAIVDRIRGADPVGVVQQAPDTRFGPDARPLPDGAAVLDAVRAVGGRHPGGLGRIRMSTVDVDGRPVVRLTARPGRREVDVLVVTGETAPGEVARVVTTDLLGPSWTVHGAGHVVLVSDGVLDEHVESAVVAAMRLVGRPGAPAPVPASPALLRFAGHVLGHAVPAGTRVSATDTTAPVTMVVADLPSRRGRPLGVRIETVDGTGPASVTFDSGSNVHVVRLAGWATAEQQRTDVVAALVGLAERWSGPDAPTGPRQFTVDDLLALAAIDEQGARWRRAVAATGGPPGPGHPVWDDFTDAAGRVAALALGGEAPAGRVAAALDLLTLDGQRLLNRLRLDQARLSESERHHLPGAGAPAPGVAPSEPAPAGPAPAGPAPAGPAPAGPAPAEPAPSEPAARRVPDEAVAGLTDGG